MMKPIVIGALGTVITRLVKGLEDLEIRGWVEIIQTTAEYWEESWRLEETCCHSNSIQQPPAKAGDKISQKSKIILLITIFSNYCNDNRDYHNTHHIYIGDITTIILVGW